jgi:hypothetical protein
MQGSRRRARRSQPARSDNEFESKLHEMWNRRHLRDYHPELEDRAPPVCLRSSSRNLDQLLDSPRHLRGICRHHTRLCVMKRWMIPPIVYPLRIDAIIRQFLRIHPDKPRAKYLNPFSLVPFVLLYLHAATSSSCQSQAALEIPQLDDINKALEVRSLR